tara:strand:- start:1313 stop:1597 length:285 start_codon:yes stop_codon:yes gene_type:complete
MTNFSEISLEGKRADYQLEKFTFKLDEAKKAMMFGSSGYFNGAEAKLASGVWPTVERWYAHGAYDAYYFKEGKFLYVSYGSLAAQTISADCDKF